MGYHQVKQSEYSWSPSRKGEWERRKSLFKGIIAENISNMGKELDIQIHEANRDAERFKQKDLQNTLNKTVKPKTKKKI